MHIPSLLYRTFPISFHIGIIFSHVVGILSSDCLACSRYLSFGSLFLYLFCNFFYGVLIIVTACFPLRIPCSLGCGTILPQRFTRHSGYCQAGIDFYVNFLVCGFLGKFLWLIQTPDPHKAQAWGLDVSREIFCLNSGEKGEVSLPLPYDRQTVL